MSTRGQNRKSSRRSSGRRHFCPPDLPDAGLHQIGCDGLFAQGAGGLQAVGAGTGGFCFDNETPRHEALLQPHRIGTRLVTNGEYLEFVRDGAYGKVDLWLADGWAAINQHGWQRPLYWGEDLESEFTLGGPRDIDAHAPVCHVSYYEADAFARWQPSPWRPWPWTSRAGTSSRDSGPIVHRESA